VRFPELFRVFPSRPDSRHAGTSKSSRVVRMLWNDRSGSTSTANNITLGTGSIIPIGSQHTATWYFFNPFPLSASSGVSSIRFVMDGSSRTSKERASR
jgi:hypothetical protein